MNKKELIKYLRSSGRLEEADEFWVDRFIFVLGTIKECESKIKKDGIMAQGDKDGKIFYQSPAAKLYSSMLRDLSLISSKIGLSSLDRQKIGVEANDGGDDGFEKE